MRVCVYGLWHLGTVTVACLAEHFQVVGYDPDRTTISKLRASQPPVFEPGLPELVQAGTAAGRLSLANSLKEALQGADVIWVTFDTPVDDNDVADTEFVWRQVETLFPHLPDGVLLLISSQVPVGFTGRIEAAFQSAHRGRRVTFAYSPENLRLGKALDAFRNPSRIVVGVRNQADQARLASLLSPFCKTIEWMSVESAEMTKHALNAFLATSITFANEVAVLCEKTGADAKEVERGLKSDPRIGQKAYLSPGGAFAGGTLARDVVFLTRIGKCTDVPTYLLSAILASNDEHKAWPRRKLEEVLGDLSGKTVAVLGLTYKPGTDTLRRSSAVELCIWLTHRGAQVQAHDPAVTELPFELRQHIRLCPTPREALYRADAMVVATEWPLFRNLSSEDLLAEMAMPVVLDPNRFLDSTLSGDSRLKYVAVGKPGKVA